MNPVLKLEREEKKEPARWEVICVAPWLDDLSREEALDELFEANANCDCGGKHTVRPMSR